MPYHITLSVTLAKLSQKSGKWILQLGELNIANGRQLASGFDFVLSNYPE